jgi:hypothetical protein
MIARYLWITLVLCCLCALAGCGDIAGKPLPMVHQDDPTYSLTPDHLDFGSLPR